MLTARTDTIEHRGMEIPLQRNNKMVMGRTASMKVNPSKSLVVDQLHHACVDMEVCVLL